MEKLIPTCALNTMGMPVKKVELFMKLDNAKSYLKSYYKFKIDKNIY